MLRRLHWLREPPVSRAQLPSEAPELVETRHHGEGADGPLPRDDPVSRRESMGQREGALLVCHALSPFISSRESPYPSTTPAASHLSIVVHAVKDSTIVSVASK